MKLPTFQPWVPWANRNDIHGRDVPGVYLLGRFDSGAPETIDLQANEIIYIGETCNQTLRKRWYQFHRSGFLRKSGHSGGWAFSDKFCDGRTIESVDWLYVAPYPVNMEEPYRSAHIRFVERWMLWLYVDRHGHLPPCNTK